MLFLPVARRSSAWRRAAGCSLALLGSLIIAPALARTTPRLLPGLQPDGSVLLPNQWSLRPAGRQIVVGDFPVNIALHPDGRYAAVLHSGYSQHEVRIIDVQAGRPVSQVELPEAFYGVAWSPDGRRLFCSGGSRETIQVFAFADGYLSAPRELRIRPRNEVGVPLGLAPSADGRALYVAEGWGQRVTKLDTQTGAHLWSHQLAPPLGTSETSPESERLDEHNDPRAPFPYTCLPDERRHRVYVSLWGLSSVLVLDARTGAELARWPVGEHPNEMALAADGRLFVAEANFNTVSVIDTTSGRVIERLSGAFEPDAPPGSMPNSLALAPDGRTLYVANANNNAIAVFDVSNAKHATSLGFIPVGWFPTSVRVTRDGRRLVVANGKGAGSAANPGGTFPGDPRPRNLTEYIGALFKGTVTLLDLPAPEHRAAQMAAWTKQAIANTPLSSALHPRLARPADSPIPAAIRTALTRGRNGSANPRGEGTPPTSAPSPIKHVIYVVKENRTYDQVLGDMAEGNGDPHLCLFPERVTPNLHAIARQFVLLDNFYVDGEVSADGHEWTMGAYASDFVEKVWPFNYGHNQSKKFAYPAEGAFAIATPARGYLWNQAARAGVSYRSYGEFAHNTSRGAVASIPILVGHVDPNYRAFDLNYPDVKRADEFIAELKRFEQRGEMPQLQVVRLGNDHTMGTVVGRHTPTAMVADNDLAVGRVVAAVTHSKFWPTTAIFILEDDAQNGPDHVDAHRSPAWVVSPYTRRHAVDSTLYSTTSVLRTIELILGLQPMSQFDAAAAPMYGAFTGKPDLSGFEARPAEVDLNATNAATAWGARESARMDFRGADRADDIVLNEIVWHSVRGPDSPMPAPVRAAFVRSQRKAKGDDDGDGD